MRVPEVAGVGFAECLAAFPVGHRLNEMGGMESGGEQTAEFIVPLMNPHSSVHTLRPSIPALQAAFGQSSSFLEDTYLKCYLDRGNAETRSPWSRKLP